MSEIKFIEGAFSIDYRGKITHVNSLNMDEIKRFYIIYHPDDSIIRAWHGHQNEKKWFYAIKGSWNCAFVKIDDWENPSINLKPEEFHLTDKKSQILCVPEGYANGLKALEPDSIMMVFSNKIFSDALKDSWRYDKKLWVNW